MRQFNLRYADLSDQNLSDCNFEGSDLEGAQFTNSNLCNANLTKTNLAEAIFTRADLSYARFVGSRMVITAFSYATLNEADLSEIIIDGMVNFRWIKAHKSKFRNIVNLNGANFFEADLTDTDFEGSDFMQVSESDRTGAILKGTLFEHLMQ
ncbi:MAG: hypothetical protein A2816_03245 [Candidatus Yanofskybacteria bacterium RIFCSPHIGHO2_01_FULL_39_44]|nr:MAG: hypothetical protein A2816_03245 [Candidatus Yanofskybacteria bacterium RIFCSPHIGHO2_01_FULL_39_44]